MNQNDDQIRISETVDRADPLTVDVVLEVHETIASVHEVDGFVRVRFRVPIAEWNAVLGRAAPSRDPIEWAAEIAAKHDCAIDISIGPYGTATVRATRDGVRADAGTVKLDALGEAPRPPPAA